MIITDNEILALIKNSDKKALALLYNNYWKPLFASSFSLLKDRELCEEIIQDVFIEFWNKRQELEIQISVRSYLYACVRYKVFAEFRKNKVSHIELYDDIDARFQYTSPETVMIHEELEEFVKLAIKSLPEKCRIVFTLSRDEKLSNKEIAEKLNISVKTVESHITNAIKIIRDSLGSLLSLELILYILFK